MKNVFSKLLGLFTRFNIHFDIANSLASIKLICVTLSIFLNMYVAKPKTKCERGLTLHNSR
jgi:hypothetical protein